MTQESPVQPDPSPIRTVALTVEQWLLVMASCRLAHVQSPAFGVQAITEEIFAQITQESR